MVGWLYKCTLLPYTVPPRLPPVFTLRPPQHTPQGSLPMNNKLAPQTINNTWKNTHTHSTLMMPRTADKPPTLRAYKCIQVEGSCVQNFLGILDFKFLDLLYGLSPTEINMPFIWQEDIKTFPSVGHDVWIKADSAGQEGGLNEPLESHYYSCVWLILSLGPAVHLNN